MVAVVWSRPISERPVNSHRRREWYDGGISRTVRGTDWTTWSVLRDTNVESGRIKRKNIAISTNLAVAGLSGESTREVNTGASRMKTSHTTLFIALVLLIARSGSASAAAPKPNCSVPPYGASGTVFAWYEKNLRKYGPADDIMTTVCRAKFHLGPNDLHTETGLSDAQIAKMSFRTLVLRLIDGIYWYLPSPPFPFTSSTQATPAGVYAPFDCIKLYGPAAGTDTCEYLGPNFKLLEGCEDYVRVVYHGNPNENVHCFFRADRWQP
jgi:hypothetical protein